MNDKVIQYVTKKIVGLIDEDTDEYTCSQEIESNILDELTALVHFKQHDDPPVIATFAVDNRPIFTKEPDSGTDPRWSNKND